MVTVLHGDNTIKSRNKLLEIITQSRATGREVEKYSASDLNLSKLQEIFGSQLLFTKPRLLIFEEVHSLPTSTKKNQLLKSLSEHTAQLPADVEVVLWEKRALTKTMLSKLAASTTEEFKVSSSMFTWLDSLTGQATPAQRQKTVQLFHQTLQEEDVVYCLIMLIRQVRMLLIANDGGTLAGPPFVVNKIRSQARKFSQKQLLQTYRELLKMDLAMKQSSSGLNLQGQLDLLLIQL